MPRPPKYPLKPLLEHRDRQVEDATVGLGDAVRAREDAVAARERAERARREAADAAAATRDEERTRLTGGELRVEDLARAEAWEVAVSAQMSDLERNVASTTRDVDAASAAESAARDALARKKADLDVVAKDEARFTDRARRASEAVEEEEAAEAWRDRKGPR